jgi:hypothetical protein
VIALSIQYLRLANKRFAVGKPPYERYPITAFSSCSANKVHLRQQLQKLLLLMAKNLSVLHLKDCSSVSKTGRQKMVNQNFDTYSDIVAPLNQAFDNGNSYGLEYVLDELVNVKPTPANQNTVDWFGTTDYFA